MLVLFASSIHRVRGLAFRHSGLHKVHRFTGYVINLIGRNCNAHLCLDRVLMLLCKLCSYVQCFSHRNSNGNAYKL